MNRPVKALIYQPQFKWRWIILFSLMLSGRLLQGQSFSVPIKFKVEDGGFEDSQILVQRNGVTSQTIPGKDRLTLELAYNADYIISFIKPGYITKKIAINTLVPADRQEQGFEPYAYGVNLFKQYEGVNTVIFNQPVAKIAYSKKIDDFDYDVDYTKSVQSAMKKAEEETQKQAEIIKAKEIELKAAEKKQAEENLKKQKEEEKKAAEVLRKKNAEALTAMKLADLKLKEEEKKKKELEKDEAQKQKASLFEDGEDQKKKAKEGDGEDKKPETKSAAGEDRQENKINRSGGEDEKANLKKKSGEDIRKPSGIMVSGIDTPPDKKLKPGSGKDLPAKIPETIDDGGIVVEEINEPNRTITKVTVRNPDGRKYVYTKVAYHWGGTYYFRNSTLSISDYIYQLYTKMK